MGFLVSFINILTMALFYAILARVLLSWVDPQGNMSVTRMLHEMTEPILGPIRKIVPTVGMFDFSPIIALLLIQVIGRALITALSGG